MEIAATIVVVVAFTALLAFFSMKKRNASWQGQVTEITERKVRTSENSDQSVNWERAVDIRYRTDEGKKGKFTVPQHAFAQEYAGLAPGDRLIKEKGVYFPRKAT